MAIVARAMENGVLDLDKPVQVYVPQFPEKSVNGEKVKVTTRQLLCHLSGVRHYSKNYMKQKSTASPPPDGATSKAEDSQKAAAASSEPDEYENAEYYIKNKFESTQAALALFKDDPLVHKPGTKYLYSTHAWTLVAAVVEGATKTKLPVLFRRLFRDLGLGNTYLDENDPLIYNRARNYIRNKNGTLINAPYVDCSYKYAGGGLLSTMPDLLQFAHIMLYSYQYQEPVTESLSAQGKGGKARSEASTTGTVPASSSSGKPGYLRPSTVREMWTPVELAKSVEEEGIFYGLGWAVMPGNLTAAAASVGGENPMYVQHTGGAIGASSVLLILPAQGGGGGEGGASASLPAGVCVAMAVNMIDVSLRKTALQIAQLFERVSDE
ncbi:serine beta-lactamase-like protein LACTB, mitochondrial [Babylonia areolata]|uniref:serine beta-lactamase-like protein LACTB, mitochondrial n=1 Tax=Babylonia areolata TaxID=304850 RepID=UPI003FD5A111